MSNHLHGYDDWKLSGPQDCDEETLKDVTCWKCDWEGDVTCQIAGNNLVWDCPGCEHEHHEDPMYRFGPDPDDRRD